VSILHIESEIVLINVIKSLILGTLNIKLGSLAIQSEPVPTFEPTLIKNTILSSIVSKTDGAHGLSPETPSVNTTIIFVKSGSSHKSNCDAAETTAAPTAVPPPLYAFAYEFFIVSQSSCALHNEYTVVAALLNVTTP
jgi:hypothetical protein